MTLSSPVIVIWFYHQAWGLCHHLLSILSFWQPPRRLPPLFNPLNPHPSPPTTIVNIQITFLRSCVQTSPLVLYLRAEMTEWKGKVEREGCHFAIFEICSTANYIEDWFDSKKKRSPPFPVPGERKRGKKKEKFTSRIPIELNDEKKISICFVINYISIS